MAAPTAAEIAAKDYKQMAAYKDGLNVEILKLLQAIHAELVKISAK